MTEPAGIEVLPVRGLPEFTAGDDLAAAVAGAAPWLADGDVVVVTSKVVSKVEGRVVPVPPGADREAVRQRAVDDETVRVVARRGPLKIVETRHGWVVAAAGIDASNVPGDTLVLLPEDADASARALRGRLRELLGVDVAVVVSDTFGRTWREGLTDVAVGCAGIPALVDHRGAVDAHGNRLETTQVAVVDELAAAADLVKGKLDGVPVAVVRGLSYPAVADDAGTRPLVRLGPGDLFPYGSRDLVPSRRPAADLVPRDGDRDPQRLGHRLAVPLRRDDVRRRGAGADQVAGGGAEQVARAQAHQRPGALVVVRHGEVQPPDDGDRDAGELALHQVPSTRQLVDQGHLRRLQPVAVRVDRAPVVDQRRDAGRSDGDVGQPVPPRPAEGVTDDHGDLHPEQLGQPHAQRPGRGVRVDGQQDQLVAGHVGGVDAGRGDHPAVPRLDDLQRAAPGDRADRLGVDRLLPDDLAVLAGSDPHQVALDLGHDLRGHDQHVAVRQPGGGTGDRPGEVVARPELGQPRDTDDRDAGRRLRHRRRRGRRAPCPWSRRGSP